MLLTYFPNDYILYDFIIWFQKSDVDKGIVSLLVMLKNYIFKVLRNHKFRFFNSFTVI